MRFPNLLGKNNRRRIEMQLKSINSSITQSFSSPVSICSCYLPYPFSSLLHPTLSIAKSSTSSFYDSAPDLYFPPLPLLFFPSRSPISFWLESDHNMPDTGHNHTQHQPPNPVNRPKRRNVPPDRAYQKSQPEDLRPMVVDWL